MTLHDTSNINPTIRERFWVHDCVMGKILVPKNPFYYGGIALIVPYSADLFTAEVSRIDRHLHWYIESASRTITALKLQGLVEYSSFAVRFGNFYPETEPLRQLLVDEKPVKLSPPTTGINKYPYRPPVWTNLPKFHVTEPKKAHNLLVHCVDSAPENDVQIQATITAISPHFKVRCVDDELCNASKYASYQEFQKAYAAHRKIYDFVVKLTDEMWSIRDHAQLAWENTPHLAWIFF